MADIMVVGSRVREWAGKSKMRVGGDFMEELSRQCAAMCAAAAKRAKANGRSTLRASDL
jgi:hypothetical protein